jgi:TetR/AcrR family transcriptional repressor of nem operon
MGRSSTARQRLLDAACELIQTRSYGAVGVADICALADVRKGSFYYFFDSKQSLTLEVIDAHWSGQRADWGATLTAPGSVLERLHRLFLDTAAEQRRTLSANGAVRGCVLANLALELSTQDRVVQTRLQEIFADQVGLIETALREAAAAGEILPESATVEIARAIVAQLEGMILFAKLGNDPDVLAGLWPQVRLLLRPLAPTSTDRANAVQHA